MIGTTIIYKHSQLDETILCKGRVLDKIRSDGTDGYVVERTHEAYDDEYDVTWKEVDKMEGLDTNNIDIIFHLNRIIGIVR
jgi:hypothetical protein